MSAGVLTFNKLGRIGRFGNQMFQIASTIGIANRLGYDFAFPEWKNYDHAAKGFAEDIDVQKYFINPLPRIDHELPEVHIPWGYHNVHVGPNVSLNGHMQSEEYFKHCHQLVRHYLQMEYHPPIEATAIHIRLGDYDDNYHPLMRLEYYEKAMSMLPKMPYIIFSDDIGLARHIFGDHHTYSEGNNYLEDFRIMRSCKQFIISNSTYSWWAAWLGEQPGKKVVAPSKWFGQIAGISSKDIVPKDWITI